MKIICEKAELLSAVTPATYVTVKNAQPTTEGIQIKAENGTCVFSAYDMEKGIRAILNAKVVEDGCYLLNAAKFRDMLGAVPDGEVTIEIDINNNVRISSGKTAMEMRASDGKQFPLLPELSGECGFTVPQKVLRRMLSQVSFAVAPKEQHRVVLQGAHFVIRQNQIRLVACDGHRLAIKDHFAEVDNRSLDGAALDLNFTVPGKALNVLSRLLTDSDEKVTIILGRKHVIFALGTLKFFARLIDGDYIDYNRFVSPEFAITAELNTADLISGLERAVLITDDRAVGQVRSNVCLRFGKDSLEVYSVSVSGKSYDEIAIDKIGDDLLIGFNCRMLLEVVRACNVERITLHLNTPLTSMVLRPAIKEENEDFLFLCLPVQLRD